MCKLLEAIHPKVASGQAPSSDSSLASNWPSSPTLEARAGLSLKRLNRNRSAALLLDVDELAIRPRLRLGCAFLDRRNNLHVERYTVELLERWDGVQVLQLVTQKQGQ